MDWMEQSAPRGEKASHSPLYHACGLWRHGREVWEGRVRAEDRLSIVERARNVGVDCLRTPSWPLWMDMCSIPSCGPLTSRDVAKSQSVPTCHLSLAPKVV
jgi:hypothetical protein